MKKVSVIIPTYNIEEYIEPSLRSVLDQDYKDMELIIIDDCSSDSTVQVIDNVIASYVGEIKIIFKKRNENRGLSAARNMGMECSSGDYLFFLDGDDMLYDSTTISDMLLVALKYGAEIVQGNFFNQAVDGTKISCQWWHNEYLPYYNRVDIEQNFKKLNFTNAANKFVRKNFIESNALIFQDGLIYEDLYWNLQTYTVVNSIATVNRYTYRRVVRDGSITKSDFSKLKAESLLFIIDNLCNRFPESVNFENVATQQAIYLLKNIFLHNFANSYKAAIFHKLYETGVFFKSVDRDALPAFSKLLSYSMGLSRFWAESYVTSLTTVYRLYLKLFNKKQ